MVRVGNKSYFMGFALAIALCTTAEAEYVFHEQYLQSPLDGTPLYTFYMPAKKELPGAPTILWIHGLLKHSRRFLHIMNFMAEQGFASIGYDVRGHGRSGGLRVHTENWIDHEHDIAAVYAYYKTQITGDLFVIAHSMGTTIITRLLQKDPTIIPAKAVLVTAPAYAPHERIISPKRRWLIYFLRHCIPCHEVLIDKNDKNCQTHDERIVEEDKKDPYIGKSATPKGIFIGLCEQEKMQRDVVNITTPYHIFASAIDRVVDVSAIHTFYSRLPDELQKSIIWYPDFYHSIVQELGKERVYEDLLACLMNYVAPKE